MKRFRFVPVLACALLICGGATAFGQAASDAVRVTMSMHPDGSRTVYNFDNAQHTAVATTTDPDGKVRQTIHYQLYNAGRSRPEKSLVRMVAFVSRAVTSMTTRATSWTKLKAQPTEPFCTRSFTVTIQQASKLAILFLMPLAN